MSPFFSVTMNSIFIKLTGNKDRHKISDKFELQPDLINHFGVTCPWVVKKNDVHFQSLSSSNFLATRTGIKSQVFKFQLDRTVGFAVKCPWVPKSFLIGCFCYAETCFGFSSSSFNSSTKGCLEFRIIFIPWANCSSGERLLPSWVTCFAPLRLRFPCPPLQSRI